MEYVRIPSSNTEAGPGAKGGYTTPLWSPDNSSIALCKGKNEECTSILLDPSTKTQTPFINGVEVLNWSPDSKRLLTYNRGTDSIAIVVVNTKQSSFLVQGSEAVWQPKAQSSVSPASINLQINPGLQKGEVKLEWTSPEIVNIDLKNYYYSIRVSSKPITEENWIQTTQIKRISIQDSRKESELIENMLLGVKLYYAVGIIDAQGNSVASISNVASLIDSGFRPAVDGYSFPNGPFGKKPDDTGWGYKSGLSFEDARDFFGLKAPCIGPEILTCIKLRLWVYRANKVMNNGGHCFGMSSTSSYFYYNPEAIQLINPQAKTLFDDIDLDDVRKLLNKESSLQLALPTSKYISDQEKSATVAKTLEQIVTAFTEKNQFFWYLRI